jgi:hypothetical protein
MPDEIDLKDLEDASGDKKDTGEEETPPSLGLSEELLAMFADLSDKPNPAEVLEKYTPEQIAAGFCRQATFTKKTQKVALLVEKVQTLQGELTELKANLDARDSQIAAREQELKDADGQLIEFLKSEAEANPALTIREILDPQASSQDSGNMDANSNISDVDLESIEDDAARDIIKSQRKEIEGLKKTVGDATQSIGNLQSTSTARDIMDLTGPMLDQRPELFPSAKSDNADHRRLRATLEQELATRLQRSGALQGKVDARTVVQDFIKDQETLFKRNLQTYVDIKKRQREETPTLEGASARAIPDPSVLKDVDPMSDAFIDLMGKIYVETADLDD